MKRYIAVIELDDGEEIAGYLLVYCNTHKEGGVNNEQT